MPERTAPDFDAFGITDRCSRCGRPYDEHPHAFGEDCIISNPPRLPFAADARSRLGVVDLARRTLRVVAQGDQVIRL